jgi:RNA polymerase sigma-70 factor (ECF subfamily)
MSADHDLILKARDGDMAAFSELLHRHDRNVLALAAQYVDTAEEAKDIFQEVLIRVYKGLPRFEFRSEFGTWVHRITVNVCLSHRRRTSKGVHISLDQAAEEDHPLQQLQSNDHGPDHVAMDADTARHIQNALQALSPRQRMVFTLRHYQGHSLKEIAQTLRCTEGTVKRYLFTATQRMREQLEGIF